MTLPTRPHAIFSFPSLAGQGAQNPRHKANPECIRDKELKIRP